MKGLLASARETISRCPREVFDAHLCLCTCIWSLSGMAKGFDEGSIASVVVMDVFIRDFHLGTQSETQYADTKGWIVAIVTAGSVAGCMSCIWITQALRRPRAFQLFTAVYIVGVVGQAVSKGSLAGLYASRVVAGFGIGGTTVLAPIYIAGPIRGLLTVQYACSLLLGVVLGFFISYAATRRFDGHSTQWQLPTSLQVVPAVFWGVGSLFTPESPRSLLAQGRRADALATLVRFGNLSPDHGYVQAEFAGIEAQLSHEAAVVAGAATADLFRETFAAAPNRRRFALIFMVQILGQWSGANAITQYSPTILGYLGVRGVEARLLATGCYAVVKLVATLLFSLLVVDLVGRRRSLLAGITLQIVTLAYIGGYLRVTAGWDAEEVNGSPSALAASRAAIAAIYLHAVAWSIGWFSIPFLVGSEVFPLRIRSVNVAALMAFHWANYFGCSRAMSSLLAATDRWGAFLFFMGVCIFSLVYVSMALPETSGRSLESMDRLFERPWYTVYKIAYPTADELRPEVRHVPEDDKGLVEPRHA